MKVALSLIVMLFGVSFLLGGCEPDLSRTVQETDNRVYSIVDLKWDDSFGTKANYQITDSAAEPNENPVFADLARSDVLTLPAAVTLATARNRQYQKEKEDLYRSALDLTDIRHLYEPIPTAGVDGGYRHDDGDEGTGGFGSLGFEQLLATGTQVGADISLGWIDILSGDFRSGFSNVATAVLTQPLLRGAGRKVALENLTQADRNVLYQIRSFNRFRKRFVTSIMTDYYDVLLLKDREENVRRYHESLVEMCERLQKRANAGLLPQHELEQANQDRLEAHSRYVRAQKDYQNTLDAFKIQLSIPPQTMIEPDMGELAALKLAVAKETRFSEEQGVATSLAQRLDLANAADRTLDAGRKVDVAADAIRAELNLVGYAAIEPSDRTVFGAEPGDLRRTRDRYEASLQLDLPIDRLAEKNAYRKALIDLMQARRDHQELTDTVVLEVRKSFREMDEARRRYEIEQAGLELAQKRAKNALLLLQYNRASTRDVLDAKEDLLDAQDAATEATVDYAVATLAFFRDTGTMKIAPDGTWESGDANKLAQVSN